MCLLKRARWFEEHLRFEDRGSASLIEDSRLADHMAWQVGTAGAARWGAGAPPPQTSMGAALWPAGFSWRAPLLLHPTHA